MQISTKYKIQKLTFKAPSIHHKCFSAKLKSMFRKIRASASERQRGIKREKVQWLFPLSWRRYFMEHGCSVFFLSVFFAAFSLQLNFIQGFNMLFRLPCEVSKDTIKSSQHQWFALYSSQQQQQKQQHSRTRTLKHISNNMTTEETHCIR